MATTVGIIRTLKNMLEMFAQEKDFKLPAGKNKLEYPSIYKYFFPLKADKEKKNDPYIVITFSEEEQSLWETTDESNLKVSLIIGICADDEDLEENIEILMAVLEKIELFLKDNSILDGATTLKKIKKVVQKEQPIPYLEGSIMLEYDYYKPILVEEP